MYRSALVVLLFGEVLALTLRFDAQALVDGGGWWGEAARYLKLVPQGLLAAGVAAAVLGGPRLVALFRPATTNGGVGVGSPWFLVLHLAAFATLTALTAAVLEGPQGWSDRSSIRIAAWLASGLLTLLSWLAAVLPAAAWVGMASGSRRLILGVIGVAALGVAAGKLTATVCVPLGAATLWTVRGLLGLVSSQVIFDPAREVVGTPAFSVEVAPECSGYEGIGLIWVFLGAYLWYFRRDFRFPRALWLLPIGTVAVWVANALRITTLVLIGSHLSPAIAAGGFHSQAGWITFNAVALGLAVASRSSRLFSAEDSPRDERDESPAPPLSASPTAAYLAPLLALIAASMLSAAFSSGHGLDFGYPIRVVAVGAALWSFRDHYRPLLICPENGSTWIVPGVVVGTFAFALWMALEPPASASDGEKIASGLSSLSPGLALLWLASRVVGSVITVPIAEELAFRGYLTRRLISHDFLAVAPGRLTAISLVVSSCVFGAFHGRVLAGIAAGMLYAFSYARKGDLREAVVAHATTNALIAASVLIFDSWSLWA